MPQRFLRPGITASRKWNSTDWFTQSFYIRLITLVDDFGRFEADSLVLRGLCFPLGDFFTEPVPLKTIVSSCEQMFAKGLVDFYKSEGKEYLQITNWKEHARSEKSKYPDNDNTCEQMFSDVIKCSLPKSSPSPSSKSSPSSAAAHPSIEEVMLAASKTGLPESEAEKFFYHYESNGWKVGKNPMKSWQSALGGWKVRWQQAGGTNQTASNTADSMKDWARLADA